MIALEIDASIVNHRVTVASDLLPASAKHAKVIVMYEESSVDREDVPDILALARAAQASFPKQNNVALQQELSAMRGEWERKLVGWAGFIAHAVRISTQRNRVGKQ